MHHFFGAQQAARQHRLVSLRPRATVGSPVHSHACATGGFCAEVNDFMGFMVTLLSRDFANYGMVGAFMVV